MAELGHTNPQLALRIYAQAMRRDADENDELRLLLEGEDLSATEEPSTDPDFGRRQAEMAGEGPNRDPVHPHWTHPKTGR